MKTEKSVDQLTLRRPIRHAWQLGMFLAVLARSRKFFRKGKKIYSLYLQEEFLEKILSSNYSLYGQDFLVKNL